jgi:hypothetical protein
MDKLLKKLNINEEFTREIRGIKFDKVKQNVYPRAGFNFMCDLLQYRYRYLFVIVDLHSNNFDIEPIRSKTPEDVLKGMKKIMTREYIPEIKASIRTDSGSEFKGIYHKWLYDNDIFHRIAKPNRHQQNANAEN